VEREIREKKDELEGEMIHQQAKIQVAKERAAKVKAGILT